MADIQWKFNSVDADTWRIQRDSGWRPPVNVRGNLLTQPGKHGSLNLDAVPVFDEPQVPFKFRVRATSQAQLENLVNQLEMNLMTPGLTLTRTSGGITSSAKARLVSIAFGQFLASSVSEVHVILAIPGVFLRGQVSTCTQKVSSSDNQLLENLTGSTAPITDPIFQVLGPATTVSITDAVTGTAFTWAGNLASGQYLYLDPANLRAWQSSSASTWTSPGGQNGTVDYPGVGLLQLWPNPSNGEVRAKVLIGGGNAAQTKWVVRAGKSYV